MSAISSSYSSGLGGKFYGFRNSNSPSSFSIGTPGSYLTDYSFGSYTHDLANTGVSMSGYTQLPSDWAAASHNF